MSYPKGVVKIKQEEPAIKSFFKTSFLDWRGRISSVIFLGGCNFKCPYCHNKDLVLSPENLYTIPFSEIEEYLISYKEWIDGVVISGGEPCINTQLYDLCLRLRKLGVGIKLDTNGSRSDLLALLIDEGLIDYIAMDFKAPLNEFSYRRCTGVRADIANIGESIDLLLQEKVDYEFRITVVPNLINPEDIKVMGERIKGARRFVIQNFIPHKTLDPSFEYIMPYTNEKLYEIKAAASSYVVECIIISPF